MTNKKEIIEDSFYEYTAELTFIINKADPTICVHHIKYPKQLLFYKEHIEDMYNVCKLELDNPSQNKNSEYNSMTYNIVTETP